MTNEFNQWDYHSPIEQLDLTPGLTKSSLIYQLIRSRLQANLAKSISASKDQLNDNDISNP